MGRPQSVCQGCTNGGKDVVVQDFKLYVNDKEYFIKAICYTPVPVGIASMNQ